MNEFYAVDLTVDIATINVDGHAEFGRVIPGVEFSIWSIDDHKIGFLNGIPARWPDVREIGADALIALTGKPIQVGDDVKLSVLSPHAHNSAILAAGAALGACGFGLIKVDPNSVLVSLDRDVFRVAVVPGDAHDERWRVRVVCA